MNAIRTLLHGAIDYAGLFPPASLDLASAVRSYAEARASDERWALGRFVIPAARLAQLADHARSFLESDAARPWRIAALAGDNLEADIAAILRFNEGTRSDLVVVDTLDLRAPSPDSLRAALALTPAALVRYAELPVTSDPARPPFVALLQRAGAGAKFRTGGVTPDAIPAPDDLLRSLQAVVRAGIPFKCTAGLHHPTRGRYPLTYALDGPTGVMHGYLNVLLAAAALLQGEAADVARRILLEEDTQAFTCVAGGVEWRDQRFPTPLLRRLRREGMQSFGSCSFREPMDELTLVSAA